MLPVISPDLKIAVVGLGYVGLPLALAFAEKYHVIGYDLDEQRIKSLASGQDNTLQVSSEELATSTIKFTSKASDLEACSIYIITVPTPVDEFKKPDLSSLLQASASVGKLVKPGNVVIYESTVYPGCTEEDCVPVLEKESGLIYNTDFYCGYSPERISPGDQMHTLKTIIKVTSGSTPEIADLVNQLYASIITAGTHQASCIKVAEASKAIENAQRDVNISFVNELALIFDKMDIDTNEVLEAASTKWNFLKFKPGLVGGHCIGVDPYYLAYKSESLGYHPEVILSGRRVNDHIPVFIASKVVKLMLAKGLPVKDSRALVLGVTFKENCPDIRNSKVIDIVNELMQFGLQVDIHDPVGDPAEVLRYYGHKLIDDIFENPYQLIILAVAHDVFLEIDIARLKNADTIVFDTRSVLKRELADGRL